MIVRLPYAEDTVVADLRGFRIRPLSPAGARGTGDPAGLVRRVFAEAAAGRSLSDMARGKKRVVIVVPDATRRAALPEVLPLLFSGLNEAGVPPTGTTVVVACGTHPPVPETAIRELVGPLQEGVRLVQHDARDDADLVPVGTTSTGLAVRINRWVAEADLRIAVGAVRHHYFAGFGGGPKMIFPGVAGYREIQTNHSRVLDLRGAEVRRHPGCEPGQLQGNPVAEEIAEASHLCAADLSLCLVPGVDGGFSQAFFGPPTDAFQDAVAAVRRAFETPSNAFDLVVGSAAGRPSDSTLIQAHKGLDAICRFLNPEGGEALFVASLDGGAGSVDMNPFLEDPRPQAILSRLQERWIQYGHTTLRIVEKTMRHTVHLVSDANPEVMSRLGFRPADSVDEVIDRWRETHPGASVGVMAGSAVYPHRRPR